MVYCHFALRNTAMFRKVTNMNGLYTISNPNTATTNEFNSDYNSFSDVEYFEVRCHFPSLQSIAPRSTPRRFPPSTLKSTGP